MSHHEIETPAADRDRFLHIPPVADRTFGQLCLHLPIDLLLSSLGSQAGSTSLDKVCLPMKSIFMPGLTKLQVAVTTGITFGCAGLISTLATVKSAYEPTAAKTVGIYAGRISAMRFNTIC